MDSKSYHYALLKNLVENYRLVRCVSLSFVLVYLNTGERFIYGFKLWYRWVTECREIYDL